MPPDPTATNADAILAPHATRQPAPLAPAASTAAPIAILESAVRGGVTQENVAVVKELIAMCREQRAEDAKAAFARAFYQLRNNMPDIHADKEGKNKAGETVFVYCSEEEIQKKLEPHLLAHGFTTLFGQSTSDGRVTVSLTLLHEHGHQEVREFTVRAGTPNAMKDGAMCDAGGATTALRHLLIKLFGLKSRISESQDAKIEGERISPDKAQYLREQVAEKKRDEAKFLAFAGVKTFEEITEATYPLLVRSLAAIR